MESELKPFWRKVFSFNWKFGTILLLVICIPRFILVLQANLSGNYGYIGLIMFLSAIVPFIFLNRYGRSKIGIRKTNVYRWLILAVAGGLLASLFLYYAGYSLYGNTLSNWFSYIGRSYKISPGISQQDKTILFIIVAGTGMIVSPIGEELFFRGIVHSAFEESVGEKQATVIDASAFSLTHLAHFGIVYENNKWQFLLEPAVIWVVSMFLVSVLFFYFRKRTGSLTGAILCHAAFNFGMTWCIFYLL